MTLHYSPENLLACYLNFQRTLAIVLYNFMQTDVDIAQFLHGYGALRFNCSRLGS